MAPRITFIYPALNEERNIRRCLDRLAAQTYPHRDIEVIVADGHSTDGTRREIAAWRAAHDIEVRIVDNDRVIAEFGTAVALKSATGDFICIQGCDEVIVHDDTLETYARAFDIFPDIAGVERLFVKIPGGNIINNYLSVIHINDPLARDIARMPRLLETRRVNGKTYRKLQFPPGYPNMLLYRREAIAKHIGRETYEEGQVALELALDGNNRICQVDGYGVYHYYIDSFAKFVRKRAKIALKHTTRSRERVTWVSHTGARLYVFAFLHLTLVYPLLFSIVRAVRSREPLWLLHAPMCFVTTLAYALRWVELKITRRRAW